MFRSGRRRIRKLFRRSRSLAGLARVMVSSQLRSICVFPFPFPFRFRSRRKQQGNGKGNGNGNGARVPLLPFPFPFPIPFPFLLIGNGIGPNHGLTAPTCL